MTHTNRYALPRQSIHAFQCGPKASRGWHAFACHDGVRLVVALVFVVLITLSPAWAVSDPNELLSNPAQEARAETIGQTLRCLVCQNESIEDSNADLARDIRTIIRQQVVAGRTDHEIVAYMVQRYGSFILLKPPFNPLTAILWATPVLALGIGLGIAFLATRQRRRAASQAPAPLSDAERARLETILHP